MTWPQLLTDFCNYMKIERGLSKNTVQSYAQDVQSLVDFLSDRKLPDTPVSIGQDTIKEYIHHYAKSRKARSQSRTISGLRAFFDFLIFENYRTNNPTAVLEAPRLGRPLPDFLSVKEINALVGAIDLSHPQGHRNKAILETLYGCGLRVSELTTLKLSDLFFEDGFIKVTGKGNKQRFVPVNDVTVKCLNMYIRHSRPETPPIKTAEDIVFLNRRGAPLTRAMVFTIIKDLAEKINLTKKISPHTFRHSFATHLLQNGANLSVIQKMLGHESITTTEIYVHTNFKSLAAVIRKYHPRSKDTSK